MVVLVGCQQDAGATIAVNAVRDLVAVRNPDFFRQSRLPTLVTPFVSFTRPRATLTRNARRPSRKLTRPLGAEITMKEPHAA
jgi:hypothetical protein